MVSEDAIYIEVGEWVLQIANFFAYGNYFWVPI
jgi:hypothetical protein